VFQKLTNAARESDQTRRAPCFRVGGRSPWPAGVEVDRAMKLPASRCKIHVACRRRADPVGPDRAAARPHPHVASAWIEPAVVAACGKPQRHVDRTLRRIRFASDASAGRGNGALAARRIDPDDRVQPRVRNPRGGRDDDYAIAAPTRGPAIPNRRGRLRIRIPR